MEGFLHSSTFYYVIGYATGLCLGLWMAFRHPRSKVDKTNRYVEALRTFGNALQFVEGITSLNYSSARNHIAPDDQSYVVRHVDALLNLAKEASKERV